ncbi:Fic family protein [Nocardiopsis xinjiangensis]|uniref:Fic family protein n=1 Tax=Nocardiopsis xinjiangensis TaxID=124285 RepID=UPI000688AFC8|nr:Fic family protein [Nocardiopsis xinjiangensis]
MSTDHLRLWLTVRDTVPWEHTRPATHTLVAPARDGAADDVRAFDAARSPERAAGMLAALEHARSDAAVGAPLEFARVASWQRSVLGTSAVGFRRGSAFAKGGRERYGTDLTGLFDACLAETAAPSPALPARAARAYLDVCFFHPFSDGNARAAFLVLVFVLARESVALDRVGPLRRLPHRADHPEGALALADLVSVLLEHACRRAAGRPDRP